MGDVTVIADTSAGELRPATNELVSAAGQIGDAVHVVVVGDAPAGAAAAAAELAGVSSVIAVAGSGLDHFDAAHWAAAIDAAAPAGHVIAAATPRGRELAARVAARRSAPVLNDCIAVAGSAPLNVKRPIFAGKAIEELSVDGDAILTLRANTWAPVGGGGSAEVRNVQREGDLGAAVKDLIAKASERLDVSEANIIISGGRGMGSPDNFSHLEAIGEQLGAAVGASRAAVDTWPDQIPHSMQIGQTGKTVNPTLYIAVGISGAIQHVAGMRTSKYIVAINKDAEAPIFKLADYGIVATWEDALPMLAAELSKLL